MAHAGEQPTFVDDRRCARVAVVSVGGEELQCDYAIEPCTPGAVHLSKCAITNRLEDTEVAPRLRARTRFVNGALLSMEVHKGREKPQLHDDRTLAVISG